MKFIGKIFEEQPNEMRGSLEIMTDKDYERILYFKSFEELKSILEEAYKRSQACLKK